MNLSPGTDSGGFQMTCPQCGTPTTRRTTCPACGAQLLAVVPPTDIQPVGALPFEFSGLKRPKVSSPVSWGGCFTIFFGLFWTLFSLIFVIAPIGMYVRDQQAYTLLSQDGQTVQGVITDLEVDDSGDSTDYLVSYRYTVVQNDRARIYTQKENVSDDWFYTLKQGMALPVIYSASRPDVAKPKALFGPPNIWGSLAFAGFGLIFVMIGLFMLAHTIAGLQDYLHFRQDNQPASATVFDLWQDKDSDGDPVYNVAYAFRAMRPDGTLQVVTRAETNRKVFHAVQIGSIIAVRYATSDPEICKIV